MPNRAILLNRVVVLLLAVLLALTVQAAFGVEGPPDLSTFPAVGAQVAPCPAGPVLLEGLDGDGDPSNGAEFLVIRTDAASVAAVVRYGSGPDGTFDRAWVRVADRWVAYDSRDAFVRDYPGACSFAPAVRREDMS